MRSALGLRFALTFARDLTIALGVVGAAAYTILITDYHVGNGGRIDARRGRLGDRTRVPHVTPAKTNNKDTSRKPKELRKWPMLH